MWASNAHGRGRGVASVRGPSKRHARAHVRGQGRPWVPGSKMPLYHYPTDTQDPGHQSLQYMEGADTMVSVRRVSPPGDLHHGQHHQHQGHKGHHGHQGHGLGGRRRDEGRRMRHNKQWNQPPQVGASNVSMVSMPVLRTVQRGSATAPLPAAPGVLTLPVRPDPSKTQRTVVQAILPVPGTPPPMNLMDGASASAAANRGARFDSPMSAPPECPADRTVLAPRGQDYVLMAKLTARDGTPLDVIAGPQAGDPVSEGPHPIVGRLVWGPRGQQRGPLCRLTYSVVVRRCGDPPVLSAPGGSTGASARSPRGHRCTSGTAWGSRCHYRCPRRGQLLRGNSWVQCGDDLQWDGRAPICTERPGFSATTHAPRRACPVPRLAEHGVLSCRSPDSDRDDNDALSMAEGSECTVSCKPPLRLQLPGVADSPVKAVTRCGAGRWNVTSWSCVRGQDLDADVDGDIAVLSDAGSASPQDWDWRDNSVVDPCVLNPCHSGGTCLRGPPKSKPICQCRPGTEGERCERVLCRGICLHGGRCVLLSGQPSCYCRRGFAGSRCQAPVKSVRYPAPTSATTTSSSATTSSTSTTSPTVATSTKYTSSTTPSTSTASTRSP